MKKLIQLIFIFTPLFLIGTKLCAQDRIEKIENQLKIITIDNPSLDNMVMLSVNGSPLDEFIRGIANTNELNISIGEGLDVKIINNFSNVTVAEVLIFLVKKYELDIDFTGSIMTITKYTPPSIPKTESEIKATYNTANDKLSLDLANEELTKVIRKITEISGKNLVLAPGIPQKKVSVFLNEVPFASALEKFAFANNMEVIETEDNFYLLSEKGKENQANNSSGNKSSFKRQNSKGLFLKARSLTDIEIAAEDISIDEIIKATASELKVNYYLLTNLQGNKTINFKSTNFDDLLNNLLEATPYTYNKTENIYLIGERKAEGLRKTKVFQLQNRSVEKLIEVIPTDLTKEVELKEFADLNSLIISGSEPQTADLIRFLEKIDQVVPMVAIEVIIVDYRKNRTVSTGITAGLGTAPSGPTTGTILPDANFSFSSSSLNNIIGNINKGSAINLGKVTPNFYLSIRALEADGIIKVKSTPKLATLNGHEATLTIGNTEYYVNEQSTFQGTLSPQTFNTRTYVPVTADLSVSIKPLVSGNDQITLEISVEQSDFTERISIDAPPGKVSRNFTSMLRVKDNEVILLGGLEEKSNNDSGEGLPLLSRIPVLKWIFGTRTRAKSSSQLNIFIKPTVIY